MEKLISAIVEWQISFLCSFASMDPSFSEELTLAPNARPSAELRLSYFKKLGAIRIPGRKMCLRGIVLTSNRIFFPIDVRTTLDAPWTLNHYRGVAASDGRRTATLASYGVTPLSVEMTALTS